MKPYLAIIADSFREALASRVLWILLVLITLVLVALLPLGYRAEQMTEFRPGDFLDARGLVKAVHRDFDARRDRRPGFASGRISARTRDRHSVTSNEKTTTTAASSSPIKPS